MIILHSNSLYKGACHGTRPCRRIPSLSELAAAWENLHLVAIRESARLERGRRQVTVTGVRALGKLLMAEVTDNYHFRGRKAHVPLQADFLDEPSPSSPIVPMLELSLIHI